MGDSLKQLVSKLKQGDMSVFDEIYQETYRPVYYTIYGILHDKSLSEDIMQDTYLKMLSSLDQFKNNYFLSFLITIAKNLSINEYNRRKKVTYDETYFETYHIPVLDSIEIKVENRELIDKALKLLTDLEKDVFLLHTLENLKHREIAKILNKPLGTITWTYQEAIKKIRHDIKED